MNLILINRSIFFFPPHSNPIKIPASMFIKAGQWDYYVHNQPVTANNYLN